MTTRKPARFSSALFTTVGLAALCALASPALAQRPPPSGGSAQLVLQAQPGIAKPANAIAQKAKASEEPVSESADGPDSGENAPKAESADESATKTKVPSKAADRPSTVAGSKKPEKADPSQKFGGSLDTIRKEVTRIPNLIRRPECPVAATIVEGEVIFPPGATDIEGPVTEYDIDAGSLANLYPDLDTSTDAFYEDLPCEGSIGGAIPAIAMEEPSAAEIEAENFINGFNVELGEAPKLEALAYFPLGDCFITFTQRREEDCDSSAFLMSGQPFEGRDIIFVHGLATKHLTDWLSNTSAAKRKWPGDEQEFTDTNGYFRKYAMDYWSDHLRENLWDINSPNSANAGYQWPQGGSPEYIPKKNRLLLISWSSNQTLEYAQHAMVKQIWMAMANGKNVLTPPNYPKRDFERPFCSNGCVFVSHSTGGLIVPTALARAARGDFGPGGEVVAKHSRLHVAFSSAVSGSRLATIAVALGDAGGGYSQAVGGVLCPIMQAFYENPSVCGLDTTFTLNSILRDLVPAVAQNVWGPLVNDAPIPTVTVAGGHPIGKYPPPTPFFHAGLDDGVVSMNSACGNPAKVVVPVEGASGIIVSSLFKSFDMGTQAPRGIAIFKAQRNHRGSGMSSRFLAGGCVPDLSPTGMVMPVEDKMRETFWDTRRRYNNHFSFLQGTIDHAHPGGGDSSNTWPSTMVGNVTVPRRYLPSLGVDNDEEMSAITDARIFQKFGDGTYLVKPDFANLMHEYYSGRSRAFKLFGKRYKIWFWRRTYHKLLNHENLAETHYVYEYVGRR